VLAVPRSCTRTLVRPSACAFWRSSAKCASSVPPDTNVVLGRTSAKGELPSEFGDGSVVTLIAGLQSEEVWLLVTRMVGECYGRGLVELEPGIVVGEHIPLHADAFIGGTAAAEVRVTCNCAQAGTPSACAAADLTATQHHACSARLY
jgi:hypothetical protein